MRFIVALASMHIGAKASACTDEIPTAQLVEAARAEVLAQAHNEAHNLVIEPANGDLRSQRVCASDVTLRARLHPNRIASRTTVMVDILTNGRVLARVPVTLHVQWWSEGLVVKAPVAARHPATSDLFERQRIDVAATHAPAVRTLAELEGKRIRTALPAGRVLTTADLEVRPPVEMGEQIAVEAHIGNVRVQTAAIAEADGFAGQQIRARVISSRELLRVRVVGDNKAMVNGDG